MKPKKWSVVLLALTMILTLLPATALAQIGPVEPNYDFIPNSGDASVSKVELVSMTEIARYYTVARNETVYNYRTNRIVMDDDGNAWVLNTGADGYLLPAGQQNLQGSIVRIQGDTSELTTTNHDPTAPLPFGTDEAVTVTPIGEPGDMPIAITIDGNVDIWVGFYGSGVLARYEVVGNSVEFAESFNSPDLMYYEMKFAPEPDGKLYISSRLSTPGEDGNPGVWSFNPSTGEFAEAWDVSSPYAILINPVTGQVYATSYETNNYGLWVLVQ